MKSATRLKTGIQRSECGFSEVSACHPIIRPSLRKFVDTPELPAEVAWGLMTGLIHGAGALFLTLAHT